MKRHKAFTRIELLAVLAAIGLLSTLGLSVLANTSARSDLAVCANNLRQVGRAFHLWASDHGGENPWWTHYNSGGSHIPTGGSSPPGNVYHIPGLGTYPTALRNNAWLQFGFIHEELRTPAPLLCPSDRINRARATHFSNSVDGLVWVPLQDRAISYFLGMHALNQFPSTMLSGDRNINDHGQDQACPVNVGTISRIEFSGLHRWNKDPNLHLDSGNILFNDGRVEGLPSSLLGRHLFLRDSENGSTHLIKPLP